LSGSGAVSTATCIEPASALTALGSHSITATYPGDANYASSNSSAVNETVNDTTTTAVTAAPASPVLGQATVSFTVTVTAGNGETATTPAGGAITVKDGATTVCTVAVSGSSGVATNSSACSYGGGSITAGTHTITANYPANGNFLTSSGTTSYIVAKDSTTGSLTAVPDTSIAGTGEAYTFTVTAANSETALSPTGSVTFSDSASSWTCTEATPATSTNGVATWNICSEPATNLNGSAGGLTHTISVTYPGDANFTAPSPLPTLSLDLSLGATSTTVTSNPTSPSSLDTAVTYTATVTGRARRPRRPRSSSTAATRGSPPTSAPSRRRT
jgi:hypothetical protein